MKTYVVLIRGINVGGKNKVPMKQLRECLEKLTFSDVSTYIVSGNVILKSNESAAIVKAKIEKMLPKCFTLDTALIKVLVLTPTQLRAVAKKKPAGFGEHPKKYHSDAIFLIDVSPAEAMRVFDPREGVDRVWKGTGVIYSERVSALRTKSRLGKIIGTPVYKSMTIRSWNTVLNLIALLER